MMHFERGAVMRTPSAEVRAGGKGIDSARVVNSLGTTAPLVLLLGDHDARRFRRMLEVEKLDYCFTTYSGDIRVATMYMEEGSPTATIINEEGPTISEMDWNRYLEAVAREMKRGEIVACMGSFPQGLTERSMAKLIELVHDNGNLLFLDTSPHFLRWAINSGVDIVSPNLDEAEAVISKSSEDLLTGDNTDGQVRAELAALRLCQMGVKIAIVHAGALGSAMAFNGKVIFLPVVEVVVASTVGAGDSLAAGFILKSEEQGDVTKMNSIDWKLSLQYGIAAAGAACELGRAGDVDPQRVAELMSQIMTADS